MRNAVILYSCMLYFFFIRFLFVFWLCVFRLVCFFVLLLTLFLFFGLYLHRFNRNDMLFYIVTIHSLFHPHSFGNAGLKCKLPVCGIRNIQRISTACSHLQPRLIITVKIRASRHYKIMLQGKMPNHILIISHI